MARLWRNLLRRREVERDLRDELRTTLELLVDEGMRRGMSRADAERAARVELGSLPAIEEHVRDVRAGAWLQLLVRDTRFAARGAVKRPGIPLLVVLALALGGAGLTTTFVLVNGILLRPLPYADGSRVVAVRHAAPGIGLDEAGLSSGLYFHYREHAASFDALAVYSETVLNLATPGDASERVPVTYAGRAFFDVLGVRPALGRGFTEEDAAPGFMDTRWPIPVLLSHGFWTRRFGADPGIIGRSILLGGRPRPVVGVMPEGFAFPRPETQVWMLFELPEGAGNFAARLDFSAIARLRPGVSPGDAVRDLARVLPAIEGRYPDATRGRIAEVGLAPIVVLLHEDATRDVRGLLWLSFGASGVLWLIAASNAATLLLLRAERRGREMAIRVALGAGRGDLVRIVMCDAALFASVAAACALLLAHFVVHAILAFTPVELPRAAEVRLDGAAVAFTTAVAIAGTLVLGGLTLLRRAILAPKSMSLRPAAVAPQDGGGIRRTLVTLQVALAVSLLAGSGLMLQSFWRMTRIDPGFDAVGLLTVEVGLPGNRASRHQQIYSDLLARLRSLPGVEHVSAASSLPLEATPHAYPFRVQGVGVTATPIRMKFVMPDYFEAMRTPLLGGVADDEAPNAVVVSAAFARRHFGGADARGRTVHRLQTDGQPVEMPDGTTGSTRPAPGWTVAAVAADVADATLREGSAEVVYVPVREPAVELSIAPIAMTLIVRSSLPAEGLAASVKQAVADVDETLSIGRVRRMGAILAASVARERFLALLLLISSLASLVLGAIAVYGVTSQSVRRREQEIGIRVAVGARPAQILAMVLRESALLVGVGLLLGLALSAGGTRVLRSFLYGVSSTDPLTLMGVSGALLLVALVATLLPARRAARLDPVVVLREGL